MSIRAGSGIWCDSCGDPLSAMDQAREWMGLTNIQYHTLRVNGIEGELHCCDPCKPLLEKAASANDPSLLPDGPIRKAFESTVSASSLRGSR